MFSFRLRAVVLAMLALLVGAPSLALAAGAPVCKGRDLSNDPEVKQHLAARVDELVNADGLLWRVDRDGTAPSYFYGTIHSNAPAAIELAFRAAVHIEGARAVATELGGPFDAAQKVNMGAGMLSAALSPGDDTIARGLPASDVGIVDAYLGAHGLPKEMAHHLKLWFLLVAVSIPDCETQGERQGLPEVDQMLAQVGRARGLPVVALESVEEQTQILSTLSEKLAGILLAAAARAPELTDDSYATLLSLYARKRPALALAIIDALPGLTGEERAAEAEFTRLLLVGRNEIMMNRAAPLLAKGGAFVAVGALHLSGKDGLIERTRAAGYRVTKVW